MKRLHFRSFLFSLVTTAVLLLTAAPVRVLGQHALAEGVELAVVDDQAGLLTVRLGPLDLPAASDHMQVEQAPEKQFEVPFSGWLRAYHPRLTDAEGQPIPNRLLHHVAFWNRERPDFLCPAKEEHIFGAGGEMNDWMAIPGFGYRVDEGDRIRVTTMFHNPTDAGYPETYLEVKVEYQAEAPEAARLQSVYPVWFDVKECGRSGYDLEPGFNETTGSFELAYSGRLLGVGGHLHDFGRELRLENATTGREIAILAAELDPAGRILSMPLVPFFLEGGYPLRKGDVVRVSAIYENATGRPLPDGAMGIVVGYFLPDDGGDLAALRKSDE